MQALDWFGRTFDDALENRNGESLRYRLRRMQHYLRQIRFLASDVVAMAGSRATPPPLLTRPSIS